MMKTILTIAMVGLGPILGSAEVSSIREGGCVLLPPHIIDHEKLSEFEDDGGHVKGLAISALGAKQMEVWHCSWPAGHQTKPLWHESEQTFVVLQGEGKVFVSGKEYPFRAPCTIICPPCSFHQFLNTGNEPIKSIAVLKAGSKIMDENWEESHLSWR